METLLFTWQPTPLLHRTRTRTRSLLLLLLRTTTTRPTLRLLLLLLAPGTTISPPPRTITTTRKRKHRRKRTPLTVGMDTLTDSTGQERRRRAFNAVRLLILTPTIITTLITPLPMGIVECGREGGEVRGKRRKHR
jgi:hypothetical protein